MLKAQHSKNEDHGIRSHYFMGNRWGNWKQCQTLFLGAPKSLQMVTADGNCSCEIEICLLLGRKVMTNLDSILKRRDITLPTKVHLVKAMVFPVVMYGCESWTVKKVKVKSLSRVRLFVTPWTIAHQAPPSMGFSRQEYWSGMPLPSPLCLRWLKYWEFQLQHQSFQ